VTHEPPKKRRATPPVPIDEEGDENDRPTVNPPFDVAAYARATADSDAPPRPPSSKSAKADSADFGSLEAPSKQITITNEVELEQARAKSATRSDPPRRLSGSALSIADARAPTGAPPARSISPTSIEAAVLGVLSPPSAPEITERMIEDPAHEMRDRFSLGDYTGALEMSELILAEDPGNLEAAECGENCRSVLESMYVARLGPLERVPIVVVPRAQMRWLSMDHRAGFILSLIDGSSTVEMILDVSGMPKLDALRILLELVQQKIVAFR
jgi:hypothetical protein